MLKKQWVAFLLAFVAPLILIFWWWGAFNSATVEITQRGPYRYAYADNVGDYTDLPQKQQDMAKRLRDQGVECGATVMVLYDDPRQTAKKKQRARVGCLIGPDIRVHDPIKVADVPSRRVVLAQVNAQPLMAPGKAYSAMLDYLEQNHIPFKLPTLEIFQNRELSVEMDL